ncbi:hypothetical protein PQR63_08420 [Herbaspirillum rhizosphaerae]|uniref:Cardiolipin synthase N-terminal domain-containing protein n=1 Tax=Herbaspirillum rhizosphaerae TaxID=346179 RepID=A0ABW8Z682_9BURK
MLYFLMPNPSLVSRLNWLNYTFFLMVAVVAIWILSGIFAAHIPESAGVVLGYLFLLAIVAYIYYLFILDDLAFKVGKNGSLWVFCALVFGPMGLTVSYFRMSSLVRHKISLEENSRQELS